MSALTYQGLTPLAINAGPFGAARLQAPPATSHADYKFRIFAPKERRQ